MPNICHDVGDCYFDVEVTFDVLGKTSFEVVISAGIGSSLSDESWGFNRLTVSFEGYPVVTSSDVTWSNTRTHDSGPDGEVNCSCSCCDFCMDQVQSFILVIVSLS